MITAAQFREHFPQLEGTAEDTLLDTFIARADGLMADYCGFPMPDAGDARTLGDETYTRRLDGPMLSNRKALCLGVRPVVSITSVDADGTALTENTDYEVDREEGILWLLPGGALTNWPVGHRVIEVELVAGFATAPPALVAITAMAVRHLWDLRQTQGYSSYSRDDYSSTREDVDHALPAAVRSALDRGYLVRPVSA